MSAILEKAAVKQDWIWFNHTDYVNWIPSTQCTGWQSATEWEALL